MRGGLSATPIRGLVTAAVLAFGAATAAQLALGAAASAVDESRRLDAAAPAKLLARLPALPRRFAADVLWVRAIQSYGYHRQGDMCFDSMRSHFEALTQVDPDFEQAYTFGALVMAQDAGDPESGIALLQRGMNRLPDRWRLPFETGFIYYVVQGDARRGARYFDLASTMPGAPEYTQHFAAYTYMLGGRQDLAKAFWAELLENSESVAVKRLAAEALGRIEELERKGQRMQGFSARGPLEIVA